MVKKVGILFGMEDTFPWAFIDRVNELGKGKVVAEAVQIDKVQQGIDYGYDVIVDRISQEVPFYRAYLKNASLMGTAVINNPFWWSADEKFFNNCLSLQIGVPVPKTVLLPSNARPDDTSDKSFRNLKAPLDWDYIFNYIGFPAYMKPHSGGGWKSVYRVDSAEDLFEKHGETEQLVMMLQEEIIFDDYYRVYSLGQKYVHIMPYEPRNEPHLRYVTEPKTKGEEHKKLMKTIHDYTIKLNKALGYDFNTVEFAIRNGVPYAIDFCNPAPDADINSVGQTNFDWIVEHSAKLAVEKALAHDRKQNNTSWGTFLQNAITPTKSKIKKSKLKTVVQAKKDKKAAVKAKKVTKATPIKAKKVVVKKATAKKLTKSASKPAVKVVKKADVKLKVVSKPKVVAKKAIKAKPKAVKKVTKKPKLATNTKAAVKKVATAKPKSVKKLTEKSKVAAKPKAVVKKVVTAKPKAVKKVTEKPKAVVKKVSPKPKAVKKAPVKKANPDDLKKI